MHSQVWVADLRAAPAGAGPWVYLGTRVRERQEAEQLLGKESRLELAGLQADACSRLRQPFLGFLSRMGEAQPDPVAWWSTRLSWRMWTASDLFLLICHLAVAQDLVRAARQRGSPLGVVVEDPWLLRQLRQNLSGAEGVSFAGGAPLWREKLRLASGGLLRRGWWLFRTLRDHARQRACWPRQGWAPPEEPAVALFSYPLASSVKGERGWTDHHLPGLDRLLQRQGWRVIRFSPPDCPGFEKDLAGRSDFFRPLILYATPGRICRSLAAFWRHRWPQPLAIDGLPVRWLLRREWWQEAGRASSCGFRLFHETFDAMLARGPWHWVVNSYENQPWEKLLALAARRRGVRVAGIQTAILSPDYLPYMLGAGEKDRMPLPDVLFTSGPYAQRVLAEGGMPIERLRMCGAIRYQPLVEAAVSEPRSVPGTVTVPGADFRTRILVVLPIHRPMCDDLLSALREAFPDGGAEQGLSFGIRPHPLCPLDRSAVGFPASVTASTFQDTRQALAAHGLVLFTGSTVGFEAMAMGRPALRYRPETTLDVDSDVYGDAVPACGERDLREALLTLVRHGPPPGWEAQAKARALQLFSPFNPAALEDLFRLKPPVVKCDVLAGSIP